MTVGTRPGTHPAVQMLDFVGSAKPGFWAQHERLRLAFRDQAGWPDWCFAPMAVALPFVGADQMVEAAKLSALAAWRMTKGIFRVDQTLMAALIETPIDAAVPVDVLLRLPGWCIYLELDQLPTFRGAARGVWVSLEPADPREIGSVYLQLLFDTERDMVTSLDERSMLLVALKLSGDSILAALDQTYPDLSPAHGRVSSIVTPVISLLLYLCSQGADLSRGGVPGTPAMPVPVSTRRRGERLFPAAAPEVWDVGARMGSALRAAFAAAPRAEGSGGLGASVIPHVRRPHWHTILSGKRKGVPPDARNRELRWMPPIAVNVRDLGDLVPTIRPVKPPPGSTSGR